MRSIHKTIDLWILYITFSALLISLIVSLFNSDLYGSILRLIGLLILLGAITYAKKASEYSKVHHNSRLAEVLTKPYYIYISYIIGFVIFYISFFIYGWQLYLSIIVATLFSVGLFLYYKTY